MSPRTQGLLAKIGARVDHHAPLHSASLELHQNRRPEPPIAGVLGLADAASRTRWSARRCWSPIREPRWEKPLGMEEVAGARLTEGCVRRKPPSMVLRFRDLPGLPQAMLVRTMYLKILSHPCSS